VRPTGFIGVFYLLKKLKMNSYELSRNFVDWAFENPDKIKPIHYGIYYFAIEHCNRLGWKNKFGLPSQMVMEAIGVKNWRTYSSGLSELVDFGFIEMIEISKNQYSSNIVAIVKNTKAPTKATTKALDKALQKHSTKHSQSTVSIDKQLNNITNNNITSNNIEERKLKFAETLKPFVEKYSREFIKEFYEYWTEPNSTNTKFRKEMQTTWSLERRLNTWSKNDKNFNNQQNGQSNNNFSKPTITDRTEAARQRLNREREELFNSTRNNNQ
jgi:hypothetical protein